MFKHFLNKLRECIVGAPRGRVYDDKIHFNIDTRIVAELIHQDGTITTHEFKNIVTQRASILVQKRLANHSDTKGITHFALGVGDPFGDIPDNLNEGQKWVCDNPPKAPSTGGRLHGLGTTESPRKPGLVNELARKKIDVIQYLDTNDAVIGTSLGNTLPVTLPVASLPVSNVPTHIAAYKALFLEHEGNGPIMEFALFGGTVWPDLDYIPSYKTNDKGILLKNDSGRFIPNDDPTNTLIDVGDMVTYKTHKLFYKTSQDRLRMTYIIKIELNPDLPEAAGD